MGWLDRLLKGLRGKPGEQDPAPDRPAQETAPSTPGASARASAETATAQREPVERAVPQEELELLEVITALQRNPGRAAGNAERAESALARLVARDRSRHALDLVRRVQRLLPESPTIQLLLAELLYDLREQTEAVSVLEKLLETPSHRTRAHFLLGSYHASHGDPRVALRHYEAVLALDFDHPRAKGRADELKARLEGPVAVAAPTILGAEDLGSGSRFMLQQELGQGGGGIVYLARDKALGRPVAVKVLHPHVVRHQDARAHLFCEARIAAALHHPGIVTIYDLDDDLNLVVMEYCAGGALADRIDRGPIPLEAALKILVQITGVLEVVHRCGVVHRDLKPANLLLRNDASWEAGTGAVLTDFGVAHADLKDKTEPSAAGTLTYMSPEQRRAVDVDARADLYACGVVLTEMLLGRRPLTPQQALQGALLRDLDSIWDEIGSSLAPPLRPAVIGLCQELVSPDPHHRPQGASEVGRRASGLIARCEELTRARAVLRELEQRAGPPPRSDAVRRWLEQQNDRLTTAV